MTTPATVLVPCTTGTEAVYVRADDEEVGVRVEAWDSATGVAYVAGPADALVKATDLHPNFRGLDAQQTSSGQRARQPRRVPVRGRRHA